MARTGEIEINLRDYTASDDYDDSFCLTKSLRSEDDLIEPHEAIHLMVTFLRGLTFGSNTIFMALEEELEDLKTEAAYVIKEHNTIL